MQRGTLVAGLLILFLATAPLSAHHVIDRTKRVQITGTVTKAVFVNPHAFIYVDVATADRTPTRWTVLGGSAAALRRMGLTEMLLKNGAEVTIHGYGTRDHSNWVEGTTITFKDGRTLPLTGVLAADAKGLKSGAPK